MYVHHLNYEEVLGGDVPYKVLLRTLVKNKPAMRMKTKSALGISNSFTQLSYFSVEDIEFIAKSRIEELKKSETKQGLDIEWKALHKRCLRQLEKEKSRV